MRGPSDLELCSGWAAHLAGHERPHLGDSVSAAIDNPAALTSRDIGNALEMISACVPTDGADFRCWLGCFLTEPKPGFEIVPEESAPDLPTLVRWRDEGRSLHRHPWARFALVETTDGPVLCCQGEAVEIERASTPAAKVICRRRQIALDQLPGVGGDTSPLTLIVELLRRGWLQADV